MSIVTLRAVVIGAGVVGLACAAQLARAGYEVLVLESEAAIGTGTSSRNSEVIHAGLYYPQGSLKAKLCVEGRRLLYEYCNEHNVPYRRCEKLVVANDVDETKKIEGLYYAGLANEVEGLSLLTAAQAQALEPALDCAAALLSSQSGIVDSHTLMLTLQGQLENAGGMVVLYTPVHSIKKADESVNSQWLVEFGGSEPGEINTDIVVNAAGLAAWDAAAAMPSYPSHRIPRRYFAKGNYFSVSCPSPFSRLIYPAPVNGGLGTHLTLDLAGRAKLGPDVEWLDTKNPKQIIYPVDPARGELFYSSVRRFWPSLPDGAIAADYSGIRPKLSGPGEPAADFFIDLPAHHGLRGVVQLFGIESPGLTAALAIAKLVTEALKD